MSDWKDGEAVCARERCVREWSGVERDGGMGELVVVGDSNVLEDVVGEFLLLVSQLSATFEAGDDDAVSGEIRGLWQRELSCFHVKPRPIEGPIVKCVMSD